ncbi:oligosaccharide flippase family protein [Terribacillus halophilus]|uniref:oligosaccharide flippase family protein n=1 Tax=Terribacillus halophilus TaxID=361279 RepID=UPI003982960C
MNTKLAKNTLLYTIGSFTSKVINMVMLPIYTYYLTTEEFGKFDYYMSIVLFLVPLISLQLSDAIFRFLLDDKDNNVCKYVTNSVYGLTITSTLSILITFILIVADFFVFSFDVFLWTLVTVSNISFTYLQFLARGLKKNKEFAFSGVINSILLAIMNIVLLIVFNIGYVGLVLSNIIAYIGGALYLAYRTKFYRHIRLQYIDNSILKILLKYSIPLIPNFLLWWVINLSDRIIIKYYLDEDALGIYGVASRFSNMLLFATTIFNQAWQESAILTFKDKEKDKYYTTIFNQYFTFLFSTILVLLPFISVVFNFVDNSYATALLIIPFLLFGVAFQAFSSFYGSAFQSSKNTSRAISSSIVAAFINLVINIVLINHIGLLGAGLSTFISFLVMWLIRIRQTTVYFKIKLELYKVLMLGLLSIGSIIVYYYLLSSLFNIGVFIVTCIIFILLNKKLLLGLIQKVRK